jgi:heptaprenylglyceryl phosphate synthase
VISWASPGPSQTLTVTASNPCPTAAWEPWSNIFVIDPGQTADINNAGYNFCVTNSGGNYVVVGGSSGGELQSFINYAGNVGASTFSP